MYWQGGVGRLARAAAITNSYVAVGSTAGQVGLVAQAGEVGRSWDNGELGLHAKEPGLSFEDAREP